MTATTTDTATAPNAPAVSDGIDPGSPGLPAGARLMTGVKPTGRLHLGNLLGAVLPYLRLAGQTETSYLGVMDLHAMTVTHDPRELATRTREMFALLLACGTDPNRTVMFVQSHVPAHTELAYLIECLAHVGEMTRMVQFKDKSDGTGDDGTRLSLLTYPALMVADVLAYRTTHVPVGADQKQHLELARTVARRANRRYGDVFTVPAPIVPAAGSRVMALDDPTRKMGKTGSTDAGTVGLLDDEATVRRRFARAVTDPFGEVRYAPVDQPGVANLLGVLGALTGQDPAGLSPGFARYSDLKTAVADETVTVLAQIRSRYAAVIGDPSGLDRLIRVGAERAQEVAGETVRDAKRALGLLPP